MLREECLQAFGPPGVVRYPLQQSLDCDRMIVESTAVPDWTSAMADDGRHYAKLPVPDPAVMRAEIAEMRNSVQPGLQPVARQLEVFGNESLLRNFKVGENAGHGTEGQCLEDHPARRHGRIVICSEIVADEIGLPVRVLGIDAGLPADAPEEVAVIESDGEARGTEIPVRTETHAHCVRDNCARGNLDPLDGFHDQASEMVVEDIPIQYGLEAGSRPETIVAWGAIGNLKGKPVAG